jgi:hypothetical protein
LLGHPIEILPNDTKWPLDREDDNDFLVFHIREFLSEPPSFFPPSLDFKKKIHNKGRSLELELVEIEEKIHDFYDKCILLQSVIHEENNA